MTDVSQADDPLKPKKTIAVSKELAAKGQLDTAITLWFHYGDPVSIHTLAAAAQDLFCALVGNEHKLAHMREWLKKHPKRVQEAIRDPQNYFKHGWRDKGKVLPYQPIIGDLILGDAALLHQDLWGLTFLLRAFTIRLALERPTIFTPDELSQSVTKGIRIDDLGSLSRPAFLQVVLQRLAIADVRIRQSKRIKG
jgi:hypothetical protein